MSANSSSGWGWMVSANSSSGVGLDGECKQ